MLYNLEQFMDDLAALTNKYGYIISGCGCCGSPCIERTDGTPAGDGLQYDETTKKYKISDMVLYETEPEEFETREMWLKENPNINDALKNSDMGAIFGAALKAME